MHTSAQTRRSVFALCKTVCIYTDHTLPNKLPCPHSRSTTSEAVSPSRRHPTSSGTNRCSKKHRVMEGSTKACIIVWHLIAESSTNLCAKKLKLRKAEANKRRAAVTCPNHFSTPQSRVAENMKPAPKPLSRSNEQRKAAPRGLASSDQRKAAPRLGTPSSTG